MTEEKRPVKTDQPDAGHHDMNCHSFSENAGPAPSGDAPEGTAAPAGDGDMLRAFRRWAGRTGRCETTEKGLRLRARPYFAAYLEHLHPGRKSEDPLAELTDTELAGFPAFFVERWTGAAWRAGKASAVRSALRRALDGRVPGRLMALIDGFRPRRRPARFTSALRQKNPTREDLERMAGWLEARGDPSRLLAAAWLRASFAAGLRPKEWRGAQWVDDPCGGVLAVPNGKQNAFMAQGTGAYRHLLFPGVENEEARRAITTFLRLLHEAMAKHMEQDGLDEDQAFWRVEANVRQVLRRANAEQRDGRPPSPDEKNITLYSGRNAFKADCLHLAGGGARRDIAALMGHGSITSQDAYAPDNISTGREGMPLALDSEKARVRGTRGQADGKRPASPDRGRTPGPRRPRPRP